MAKGKFQRWLEPDGLILLEGWARDGLTDEQIANKMGINVATLYRYKQSYCEICNALKKGKEVVDLEVENALLKKAYGYNAEIKKTFKIRIIDYDPNTGKKIREHEELKQAIDEVHVPADTTAQIFWLKNRRPDKFRDKPEAADSGGKESGVVLLAPVDESLLDDEKEGAEDE